MCATVYKRYMTCTESCHLRVSRTIYPLLQQYIQYYSTTSGVHYVGRDQSNYFQHFVITSQYSCMQAVVSEKSSRLTVTVSPNRHLSGSERNIPGTHEV